MCTTVCMHEKQYMRMHIRTMYVCMHMHRYVHPRTGTLAFVVLSLWEMKMYYLNGFLSNAFKGLKGFGAFELKNFVCLKCQ